MAGYGPPPRRHFRAATSAPPPPRSHDNPDAVTVAGSLQGELGCSADGEGTEPPAPDEATEPAAEEAGEEGEGAS